MKSVPKQVVIDLRALLKEAEVWEKHAADHWVEGRIDAGDSSMAMAERAYARISARALVHLLEALAG